jgi:hypothetical protein
VTRRVIAECRLVRQNEGVGGSGGFFPILVLWRARLRAASLKRTAALHALMAKIMTKPASLPDDENQPGHLPRLTDAAYRGKAIVHWTLTVRDRGTGSGWMLASPHAFAGCCCMLVGVMQWTARCIA